MANRSEIKFDVTTDENKVPEKIEWQAESTDQGDCDAVMLSIWDKNEKNTLRVDLWTKDMQVDEMKLFMYQSLLTSADSFARATGEHNRAEELKQFAHDWGMRLGIIKPADEK